MVCSIISFIKALIVIENLRETKMNKIILIILTMSVLSSNAFAGSYYRDRTITGVGIYYVGDKSVLLIDIDGAKTGMPACASTGRLAINSSAPPF